MYALCLTNQIFIQKVPDQQRQTQAEAQLGNLTVNIEDSAETDSKTLVLTGISFENIVDNGFDCQLYYDRLVLAPGECKVDNPRKLESFLLNSDKRYHPDYNTLSSVDYELTNRTSS